MRSPGPRASSPYDGRRTPPPPNRSTSEKSDARDDLWNRMRFATRMMVSCFRAPVDDDVDVDDHTTTTTSPRGVQEFPNNYSFPSVVSSNSSLSSERRANRKGMHSPSQSAHTHPGSITFTMHEINKCTKKFSSSHKIGQGAFGTVYKGKLADGTMVAIKRANKDDKSLNVTFLNEISTLARIDHLNLVKFMGYLEHKDERLIIVEYVPNGTLREHLDCIRGNTLDLASRLEIAIDVAHAITYLHMYSDHPIIHRDIKSSNILLTDNLRAKVADFGLARLGSADLAVTHVLTEVKGTVGYLDPEYLITNQLTVKSDVYSFGILLVELVTGRMAVEEKRPSNEQQTSRWAMRKFTDGKHIEVIDPKIPQTPAGNVALEKILKLAFKCLSPTKDNRPDMKRCAEILWHIRRQYKAALSSVPLSPSHK